jgi:hypothetical protein
MWEIGEIVKGELVKAKQKAYVMFIHGWSTSMPGKTTARSVVRGFMRLPEATPLIVRSECIQYNTIFRAKLRLPDDEDDPPAIESGRQGRNSPRQDRSRKP